MQPHRGQPEWELYHLVDDIGEKHDLAGARRDKLAELEVI